MTGFQRVALTTLGCKTNQFETAAMTEQLQREGFVLVPFDDVADIYIINTCTVTSRTDAESRRVIRRARRRNSSARIVVTGCFAQVAPEEVAALEEVDLIIGNAEKRDIVALLREVAGDRRIIVSPADNEERGEPLVLETFAEHTRAFLQIQNGCNSFCSYCIVPYARGRSRSVSVNDALEGVRSFAGKGYREVVLTGIHLGSYGLDLDPPSSLAELSDAVEKDRLVPRLRLGSVEPLDITEDLLKTVASASCVCPHLHIPLQSGSDSVLGRMGRQYTGDFYRRLVERLVETVPDIFIGADVIAGFPGETDHEFRETYTLIESLPLAHLHVFPFSRRKGTPAATMPGQVPPAIIKERAELLRRLADRKKQVFSEKYIGRTLPVLLQNPDAEGVVSGLSRNYLSITLAGATILPGEEKEVLVIDCEGGRLRGKIVG